MCLLRFLAGPGFCLGGRVSGGMGHFCRLIFALLCFACSYAAASVPMETQYIAYRNDWSETSASWASSKEAAIAAWCVSGAPNVYGDYDVISCSAMVAGGYTASIKSKRGGAPFTVSDGIYFRSQVSCPANSVSNGSSCTCAKDHAEVNGQCVAPNKDDKCAGDFNLSGFALGSGKLLDSQVLNGDVPSGNMCWPYDSPSSGCTVRFVQDKVVTMPGGTKQTYGRIGMYQGEPGATQGKACEVPVANPGDGTTVEEKCNKAGYASSESSPGGRVCLDPPKCPGGYGGEVNGVEVCVQDEGTNVVKTQKETETKNKDGSTEKVTEKTSCQGSKCTTEKTTTNTPAGGGSSTVTNVTNTVQSKEDYCKANANAAQCKGSSGDGDGKKGSFGGSCSAGFTCEGDALQCSIAQEQHKRSCELMSNPSDESKLYDANKGKTGNQTGGLPGNESVDLGGERIDTSSALGGGSCISDIQISVMGQSANLPLSDLCKWPEYMGNILVAVALLGALRIIAGS